jgi:hypothetical protein
MLDMNWVRTQMNNASATQRGLARKASNSAPAIGSRRLLVGFAIALALSLGTSLAIVKQLSRSLPVQA